ncbi:hypothetical protein JW930_04315 [Candidatus Woesearchaeota archaeon]|nr:hypothetical protein [Candidatus Woesearchaeota archaeon]
MTPEIIALLIFTLTYLLFISELVHKTVAALIGAMLMVAYGILSYNEIGSTIDYKTLTVAIGMMITINVVKKSGLFEYLSIKAVKITKGNPTKLMVVIVLLSTLISTFFSNITSTLILGTLVISLCHMLDLDFVPYLVIIAISVNIAGLLTPISSLPNIMVSAAAGLSFGDFGLNLLLLGILLLASTIIFFMFFFRKTLTKRISREEIDRLKQLDENKEIKNKKLFTRSCIILGLIVFFFLIQDVTHIGNEAIAIAGAIIMLLLSSADPEEMLSQVQWSTIAFFIGLFIVIGGIEKVGLLDKISYLLAEHISSLLSAMFLILSGSAISSSIVDNIPVTAVLLPILKNLNSILNISGNFLFYPLIAGVAIGGNITPIASPANVIAVGLAEKNKKRISFGYFMKAGLFLSLLHMIISTLYFSAMIYLQFGSL